MASSRLFAKPLLQCCSLAVGEPNWACGKVRLGEDAGPPTEACERADPGRNPLAVPLLFAAYPVPNALANRPLLASVVCERMGRGGAGAGD